MVFKIGLLATLITFFLHLFGVEAVTPSIILACGAVACAGFFLECIKAIVFFLSP